MKSRSITPAEFDIGALINNEEIFERVKHKIFPERMLLEPLKKLVSVMLKVGCSIDDIMREDKSSAIYAMELSNHVQGWQLNLKQKGYVDSTGQYSKKVDVKEGLRDFLPKPQQKHCESESFRFLCQMLEKFLKEKNDFEMNQAALSVAKENFDSYCEQMESGDD